jgi:hypothetical protein
MMGYIIINNTGKPNDTEVYDEDGNRIKGIISEEMLPIRADVKAYTTEDDN